MSVARFRGAAPRRARPAIAQAGRARRRSRARARSTATRAAVGQNTNLGIVLLCAPLAAAAERGAPTLRAALAAVLDDARPRRRAPTSSRRSPLANPGGLGPRDAARRARAADGSAARGDGGGGGPRSHRAAICHATSPTFSSSACRRLRAARAARRRRALGDARGLSRVSRRLPRYPYRAQIRRRRPPRRCGEKRRLGATPSPRLAIPRRCAERPAAWDAALKARGLNPGTSADLTVATLFAANLARRCVDDASCSRRATMIDLASRDRSPRLSGQPIPPLKAGC